MRKKITKALILMLVVITLASTMSIAAFAQAPATPSNPQFNWHASVQEEAYLNELFRLINAERVRNGAPRLTPNPALSRAAAIRAREAQEAGVNFLHHGLRPCGSAASTIAAQVGIHGFPANSYGENLVLNAGTARNVFDTWMNSPAHRERMLSPEWTTTGLGIYTHRSGTVSVAQTFHRNTLRFMPNTHQVTLNAHQSMQLTITDTARLTAANAAGAWVRWGFYTDAVAEYFTISTEGLLTARAVSASRLPFTGWVSATILDANNNRLERIFIRVTHGGVTLPAAVSVNWQTANNWQTINNWNHATFSGPGWSNPNWYNPGWNTATGSNQVWNCRDCGWRSCDRDRNRCDCRRCDCR